MNHKHRQVVQIDHVQPALQDSIKIFLIKHHAKLVPQEAIKIVKIKHLVQLVLQVRSQKLEQEIVGHAKQVLTQQLVPILAFPVQLVGIVQEAFYLFLAKQVSTQELVPLLA